MLFAASASRQSLPRPCSRTAELAALTSTERLVGPLRQGDLAMFLAVSFLFAFFRIWGCDPRLIFPVAKVGLTVHRKTSPPGLSA